MFTRVVATVFVVTGLLSGVAKTQGTPPKPASGSAVVLGKVTDGPGGPGVAEATVALRAYSTGSQRTVLTDVNGQFVFFNVADDTYDLAASKPGYWFGQFGQHASRDRGQDFVVANGRAPLQVAISLWKPGEVTGIVTDEHGDAAAGWTVQYLYPLARGGRLRWFAQTARALTDDRGRYRVSDLSPGQFVFVLLPPRVSYESNGRLWSYPPMLYGGGVSVRTARQFAVKVGDEIAGVNFQPRPVESHQISGRLISAASPVRAPVRLTIWDEDAMREVEVRVAAAGRAGEFTFANVPAGVYRVSAWNAGVSMVGAEAVDDYGNASGAPSSAPAQPPDAMTRVTVADVDVVGVELVLPPRVTVTGRAVFHGATTPSPEPTRSVGARIFTPAGDYVGSGRGAARGEFTISVVPGIYFVRPDSAPPGWALESITSAGRDALDSPLIVDGNGAADVVFTFTDQVSEIDGRVSASDGGAAPQDQELVVLIFPVDEKRWLDFGDPAPRIREALVQASGTFTVRGLPNGEYFLAAMTRTDAGDAWQLASTFARLARTAARARIADGKKVSVSLRLVGR